MVLYEQRACRHILGFRPNYACQIVGYTRSGKKMIHLNFFPRLMIAVTRALPGTTEPSWHSPVSYTHLDVYKRQPGSRRAPAGIP